MRTRQMIYTCRGCHTLYYALKARTYCNDTCRLNVLERDRQHKIAEFQWIAGTDTWDNIANRLGYTSAKQLREWLRKVGLDVWADRINADIQMPRQGRWAA